MNTPHQRTAGSALLWLALVATTTAPVAINAVNLYRLSTDRLGLTGAAALALPVTLDGAALVALTIRMRALREGDGAPGASAAVLAFAGLSAWLAAVEGNAVGGVVGAVALGALPVVAVVMLELATASVHRKDLRAAGLLPSRPPMFSPLRWLLAPTSTFRAWRHGVLWERSDRDECLAATTPEWARPQVRQLPEAPSAREVLARPTPPRAVAARPVLVSGAVDDGLPPAPWDRDAVDLARRWVAWMVDTEDRLPTRTELARRSGWDRESLAASRLRTIARERGAA